MSIEELGRFYVKSDRRRTGDGTETVSFEVGEIVIIDGRKIYKDSDDQGFQTREDARAWIQEHSGNYDNF